MDMQNCQSEKNEFIVEAMMHDGNFVVAGKVHVNRTLLSDKDLEIIWDLANWGVNAGRYYGYRCYTNGEFVYIPMTEKVGVVNANVFVHELFDTENGYYISSKQLHPSQGRDEWHYGKRTNVILEYWSNPFIVSQKHKYKYTKNGIY